MKPKFDEKEPTDEEMMEAYEDAHPRFVNNSNWDGDAIGCLVVLIFIIVFLAIGIFGR